MSRKLSCTLMLNAVLALAALAACSKATFSSLNAQGGKTEAAADQLPMGVRNFYQMNYQMASLTGIPISSKAVSDAYTGKNQLKLSDSLASGNDARSFNSSNQLSNMKLATAYCTTLIANKTYRDHIYGSFNFDLPLGTAFSDTAKTALINSSITAFWGANPTVPDVAVTTQMVSELIDGLSADQISLSHNDVTGTANVVTGVCVTFLSSLPVSLL